MLVTQVPKTLTDLITLAVKARAGAVMHGALIKLEQNTSAAIAADLFDLTGDPATPLVPGKQAILNQRNQALKDALIPARLAIKAGREYCRLGVALLKPILGPRYNGAWAAAGFLTPSLAMPEAPVAMLIQFRQYFEANAAQENAPSGITAAQAHARMTQIETTELAVAAASAARFAAKRVRDLAARALAKRMMGLRTELVQLLSREDGIWREFGFRRPADGRFPYEVEGLELTAGAAGTVIVRWESARLAEQYRVSWRPSGAPIEDALEVGLFSDRQAVLDGLPSGSSVVVGVSARNELGETDPTEATITVP